MSTRRRTWTKVADLDELPEGRVKPVTCAAQTLCLTHHQGQYAALDNKCPHQNGPLGEGSREGAAARGRSREGGQLGRDLRRLDPPGGE